MHNRIHHLSLTSIALASLLATGCGGDGAAPTPPADATTTNVSTTVIDGAIKNALVCVDKNANGRCESDEPQGRTDASGQVTIAVANADVGKYALVALVGTDAVDAVNGAVSVAYTLSTPAGQTGIVSPLTTLVQQTAAGSGVSSASAAQALQATIGTAASLFQDYTQAGPTSGGVSLATLARLLVVTAQQQSTAVAGALGTKTIDGAAITQADLDQAVQHKLLELLPDIVVAAADPVVLNAGTAAQQEAAVQAAALTLVQNSGLTAAAAATLVAVNSQAPATDTPAAPSASLQLHTLSFSDAQNYFVRYLTSSLAQATPDASNNIRYVDRRHRSTSGSLAVWGSGSDPWRGADLHWNGSQWANCPINTENASGVRDAQGDNVYDYCGGVETGKSHRATFDIGGQSMANVYAQIRGAGYTNLTIDDPTLLGSASFPSGAKVFYQANTALTTAIAYYPGGVGSPTGSGNVVNQYSAAIAAGGTAANQAAGTGCNAPETSTNGSDSTTLEGLVASRPGTPCVYAPGSFVYGGVTYSSGDKNEWWGNSTVSLGTLGTAPVNSGAAPGYYTTNTLLRVAFTGGGNAVAYYACQQRFNNGSPRNCSAIGSGSYTITTLGDGRALSFSNLPAQAAALTYARVFVERGGHVFYGYQSKPLVSNAARLNTEAARALVQQLGLTPEDLSVPLALTAASYQGSWDLRDAAATSATDGTTVFISVTGSISCQDRPSGSFSACSLSITDPATGAFTFSDGVSSASGTIDYMAGTASGTYHDPTSTPVDGSFVGQRR